MKRVLTIFIIAFCISISCAHRQERQALEFWHFWTDPQAKPVIEQVVKVFERENPGWKVNLTGLTWADGHQKIVVAFGADKPPDLLELGSDWIAEFAFTGALADLNYDTSGMLLVNNAVLNGRIYGRPWFVDSRVLYYNLDLFDKASVKPPADWNELEQACAAINGLGEGISGFGANSNEPHRLYKKFLPFLWSSGGDITCGSDICLDTKPMHKSLEYYARLARAGRIDSQKNLEDAFVGGKIGVIISGGWLLQRLVKLNPPFEFRLAEMIPEEKNRIGISFAGGEFLVIPAKSANKEMALKLMELLAEKKYSQMLCDSVGFGFPPYRFFAPTDTNKMVLFNQLQNCRIASLHPQWVYIEQIIEDMVEAVMLGEISPAQAIAAAQKKIAETREN